MTIDPNGRESTRGYMAKDELSSDEFDELCAQTGLPGRYPIVSEQPDAEERP